MNATTTMDRMLDGLPRKAQNRIYGVLDNLRVMGSVGNARVAASMAPSVVRGLVLGRAHSGDAVPMQARHAAHFDLTYQNEFPEMYEHFEMAALVHDLGGAVELAVEPGHRLGDLCRGI